MKNSTKSVVAAAMTAGILAGPAAMAASAHHHYTFCDKDSKTWIEVWFRAAKAQQSPPNAASNSSEYNEAGSYDTGVKCSPEGATGATGPKGDTGATGAKGSTGATGPAGPTGATGSSGPVGAAGSTGVAGAPGASGAAGPAGATGPAGPTGGSGNDGLPGPQGTPGPQGPQGATGPAGSNGSDGSNGNPGQDGSVGPKGDDGASAFIYSTKLNNEASGLYCKGAGGVAFYYGTLGNSQEPKVTVLCNGADGQNGADGTPGARGPAGKTVIVKVDGTQETVDGLPATGTDAGNTWALALVGASILAIGSGSIWVLRKRP